MNATALNPEQFIFASDNTLKTTSLKIAEAFKKRHDHVIRDIKKTIEATKDTLTAPKFGECQRINELANNKPEPYYEMDKDGFILVVMGYTGAKAMIIKVDYINAFNFMHDKLFPKTQYGLKSLPTQQTLLPEPPAITKAQTGILYNKVCAIAGGDNKIRAAVWKRFQNHFTLSSYKDLPDTKFDEAVAYLEAKQEEYRQGVEMLYISTKELDLLIRERIIALPAPEAKQGEVLPKPTNTITVDLNLPQGLKQIQFVFNTQGVAYGRWAMWQSDGVFTVRIMENDEFLTSSKDLPKRIADSMGGAVKRDDLPRIIQAAVTRAF